MVGVHYGTGRHYYDLATEDQKEALKVIQAKPLHKLRLLTKAVLVVLLHLVLPHNDRFQNLNRLFSPPHHIPPHRHLDHLQRHGHHSPHRRRLLLRHNVPMHTHLVFLEQRSKRLLRRYGSHYCAYVPLQRLQRYMRFHLCVASYGYYLEVEYQQEEQDCFVPDYGYGLRVSA